MYFCDADGTLLDSNGIWLDIDRDFLARHGISPVPEDYTEYVTHHSFPDAAAYTRRRFGLDMPEEDICRAWLDMALEAYSHQLPLKPGAGEYVRRAHERGERCALLSSCMPELCRAALAHHGLTDCFSHILTAAELGLEVRTAAFRDSRGLLHLEAEGPGCAALARPERLSELSALLGVPLRLERRGEGSLSLIQQEPLMAVAGVAAQRKGGETVSGDAGTYFKRPDGMLYVLLCDGMGSGPEANRESTLAVRLLEQFLQAGVPARQALSTLASALALRGEDAGGFTTVDLLQIDLFTGDGELYKLGAAPTYVKRSGAVQRLSGSALPAGLSAGEEPVSDRFPLRLSPGDTVLMVSDGICGTGDDRWLREKLEAFDGASPKDLARELITQSPQGATDDRTALVIRVEKRRVFDN